VSDGAPATGSAAAPWPSAAPPWRAQLHEASIDAAVERLAAACREHRTVVLAGHVSPDGDTLGSALALHLALGAAGARTLPTVGEEPLELEPALALLPGVEALVPVADLPPAGEVDLLVALDAAGPARLGTVAGYLDAGVPTIVLDHHERSVPFGELSLVAPGAAATVQVVALLLDELDLPLTRDVATCLYVGLVTDTGRFSYQATGPDAHLLGARLLAAGVDQATWSQRLFETRRLDDLTLLGRALGRAGFVPEVALVHTHLSPEDLAVAAQGSTEGLIDLLRTADVAEVALTLRPAPDGSWQGSLRSRGRVDVGRIAAALGGGGHRLAAGFDAGGTAETVVEQVVALLREG
jgi:bifunctional oligoribonuclease and PAP phosphatase NrnA